MKIIIDCNIIISAGLGSEKCNKVVHTVIESHEHYLSDPILEEYYEVCSRAKFKSHKKRIHELMKTICSQSIFIKYIKTDFNLRDKKDEKYMHTAIIADIDYIITGNLKDFPAKHGKIKTCSPAEFLQLCEA